ncbi:riboflavin biosynthesis protein [Ophiostoma piceae UAMH 11346]|uniref:2,5-diamino-6-ribosylamino-4(3H)-pyrimidinone 5'-phosphate reductase n=1 Tax=Ophiostoma piceae (strain UAMH 11346) TaxID=1262450 RepID=S3C591_OPHP1|nr:riboflavin biosynthesis protein [Ophiostoma piceae UAMH 11346]
MAEVLHFPTEDAAKLESYLPPRTLPAPSKATQDNSSRPFVTLTFATSLDSSLALAPGVRTALSGPKSKAMTHYLRSRHDAILVGVGTAVADDPGLNCRISSDDAEGTVAPTAGTASTPTITSHQPRPIIIDPHDRWSLTYDSRVLATQRCGLGLAPYVVTAVSEPDPAKRQLLEAHGGKYLVISTGGGATGNQDTTRFRWEDILASVARQGLRSIMIEGGGSIINTLLAPVNTNLVDSVIITIAPTWLGRGGVVVSPDRVHDDNNQATAAARLKDVKWKQLGDDVILCGRLNSLVC